MLYGRELTNPGCGRLAMQTRERAFWQSRMTVAGGRAEPPELTDLEALARAIRAGWSA
jgi:hypothetical protein